MHTPNMKLRFFSLSLIPSNSFRETQVTQVMTFFVVPLSTQHYVQDQISGPRLESSAMSMALEIYFDRPFGSTWLRIWKIYEDHKNQTDFW